MPTPEENALLEATKKGDYEKAKDLLLNKSKPINVNCIDGLGFTPLCWLAKRGNSGVNDADALNLAKLLVNQGGLINQANADGNTALHIALQWKHVAFAKWLLKAGADHEQPTGNGTTPLGVAVSNGCLELVKRLIKKYRVRLESRDHEDNTPLCLAAWTNQAAEAEVLLQAGAKLEVANQFGHTPLLIAASRDNLAVLKLLQAKGANLTATNLQGNNALSLASTWGHVETVNYLLSQKLEATHTNGQGLTPPELAALNGNKAIVALYAERRLWVDEAKIQELQKELLTVYEMAKQCYANRDYEQAKDLFEKLTATLPKLGPPAVWTLYNTCVQLLKTLYLLNKSIVRSPLAHSATADLPITFNPAPIATLTTPPSSTEVPKSPHALQAIIQSPLPVLNEQGQLALFFKIPYTDLTLGEKLGQGSYGIVYKASYGYRYRHVAVKCLIQQNLTPELIESFKQEASLMVRLKSDYTVQCYGVCLEAPHYALVMEYMPGGTLYHLLNSHQPLSWPLRYQMALDISCGLAYLHGENIVHGDLKSLNIMLDNHYQAKITDFGLSKLKAATREVPEAGREGLKTAGTIIGPSWGGSVRWMAPELFKPHAKTAFTSDVYSFGVIAWELGARTIPYKAIPNDHTVTAQIVQDETETITPDTPVPLAKLIRWCWEKPANRPRMTQAVTLLQAEQATVINVNVLINNGQRLTT